MSSPEIKITATLDGMGSISKRLQEIEAQVQRMADRSSKAGQKVGDGLEKGLKGTATALKTTGSVGARSFTVLRTGVSGLVTVLQTGVSVLTSMTKLAVDLGAKTAIVGAAAYGVARAWVSTTSQTVSDMRTMAKSVGVSTESFSRLASAIRLTGGDTADLTGGLQIMSDKIVDAAKDTEKTGASWRAFNQLGVDVRNANGDLKTTEEVLRDVADGLKKVPSDTLRASAAFDIFGGQATKLMPILSDGADGLDALMKQADRTGTVVNDKQAAEAERLLQKQRLVREAWRGLSFSISEALLPAFTKSSDRMTDHITKNSAAITKWTAEKVKDIEGLGKDLAVALGFSGGSIERTFVRRIAPALRLVRDVAGDTFDMINGRKAIRLPWLNDISSSLWTAADAAKEFGKAIWMSTGASMDDFPTMAELADKLKTAIEGLRNGLSGGDSAKASMPWASKLGEVLRNLGIAFGAVAGVLYNNREEITSVLASISAAFRDFVIAVSALLNGDEIPKDNPFAFLQPVSDFVDKYGESIKATFTNMVGDIGAAFGTLWGFFESFYGWLDSLAQMLGLRSGLQLGLIVFAAWFFGLTAIAQKVGTAISTTLFIINGLFGLFGNVVKLFKGSFGIIMTVTRFIMTRLPAALLVGRLGLLAFSLTFGLVVTAITAVLTAIWYFRDEIWSFIKWVGSAVADSAGTAWRIAKNSARAILLPIETMITALKKVGKWIGLIDEDKAVAPFEAAGERISDAAEGVTDSVIENSKKTREIVSASALQTSDAWSKSFDGIEKDGAALDGVGKKFDVLSETASDAAKGWSDFWETGNVANDFSTASAQRNLQALQKKHSLTADQIKAGLAGEADGLSVDAKADIGAARIELRSLGHDIEDVAGSAKLIWSRTADGITDAAKAAGTSISTTLSDGLEAAPKIVDGVKSRVNALPDEMRPAIDKLKDQLGEGINLDDLSLDFDTSKLMESMGDLGANAQTGLQSAWDKFPAQVQTQVDAAGSAMQSLVDKTDHYQADTLSKIEKSWGAFETFFRQKVGSVAVLFADFWQSMVEVPAAVYDSVIATWSEMPADFDELTDGVATSFDNMWKGIKSASAAAMLYIGKEIALFMLRATARQAKEALFTPAILENAKSAFVQTFDGVLFHQETVFEKMQRVAGETVTGLLESWSTVTSSFADLTDQIGSYFDALFERIEQRAAVAMFNMQADIAAAVGKFVVNQVVGAVGSAAGFASGGLVRGPGTGTSDSIPAWLSNGEGVLTAKALRHYGSGIVGMINNLMLPRTGFAEGGVIGSIIPARTQGSNLAPLSLAIGGQRMGGKAYVDSDALHSIKRDFRDRASASRGPLPRWRGF